MGLPANKVNLFLSYLISFCFKVAITLTRRPFQRYPVSFQGGYFFKSKDVRDEALDLFRYKCTLKCSSKEYIKPKLQQHMHKVHHMSLCDECDGKDASVCSY